MSSRNVISIKIDTVNNGWLVTLDCYNNDSDYNVFTSRSKMIKYINDIIPPTGDEAKFLSGVDSCVTDQDKRIEELSIPF